MRTQNSIKNIITTILPFVIIGILGFIKVKVFVAFLRDDLYSLNQLFYQIFSYLSLAEAGFGLFIIQKYYKLLASDDKTEIKKIFANSVAFFRLVGGFIVLASVGLSFFVHLLTRAETGRIYMQSIFLLFIIKNVIDYFMMAPRFLISADQKMFKINLWINAFRIIEIITEVALVYLQVDYLIVLIPGIIIKILANILINRIVYNEYDYVRHIKPSLDLSKLKGIGHIFTQRIVGIFHSNTDIVLISAFINPMTVVSYASYTYVTKFIFDITYMIASAINASFAHVVNNNKHNTRKVFKDLETIFILEASVVFIVLYSFLNEIIRFWVGEKYLISGFSLWLLLLILYLQIVMRPLYMTVDSEGYFKETKKILIAEASINFIISILLINGLGLAGVLVGTFTSILVTSFWYLPGFIYKKTFNQSAGSFFARICANLILTIAGAVGFKIIFGPSSSVKVLMIKFLIVGVLSIIYALTVNYKLLNIKSLIDRFKYMIKERHAKK